MQSKVNSRRSLSCPLCPAAVPGAGQGAGREQQGGGSTLGLGRELGAAAPEIWKGFGSSLLPGAGQDPSAGTRGWDRAILACVMCRGRDQPGAVNDEMLRGADYTLVCFQSIALLFVLV